MKLEATSLSLLGDASDTGKKSDDDLIFPHAPESDGLIEEHSPPKQPFVSSAGEALGSLIEITLLAAASCFEC